VRNEASLRNWKEDETIFAGDIMANETKYGLPSVMTVKELSEYLRVHPSTVYKLLRRGELPAFRIGTDWRFNAELIDRWCLERNAKAPDGGTSNQN
jgi:excisionase family DNA binding protein